VSGSGERDQSVDRLLRRSLRTPRPDGVTDSCLDAETLAAWVDGGLSGAALEMAQSHVADCARCQTLVGTLARINVAVPPAEHERASRRWLAWLVPLTAAAAAVAIWVAVPRDTGGRLPQTEVQKQAAETSAQAPRSLEDRPQAFASEPASGKVEQPAQKEQKEVARANQLRVQAPEARRDAGRLAAENQQPQSAIAPSAPAPPAPSAAATPLVADRAVGVARSTERSGQAPIEIVSPDPSVRWRIVRSVVQRSTDGGSRWADVPTGSAAELTAGVAPSASVCWLVGRGGVVLLSADGRNWRQVAFPEAADLSAVRATDARTASVSTADGRTFSTTDAGATWVPR
jgi:hypothetical protein